MRVAHITDFHLPAKPGQGLNNTLPDANLIEAVSVLKRQSPKPDLIVLGGDMLDNGQKGNYEAIAELFKDVEAPLYTVVGNHDDLKTLRKSSLAGRDGDFRGYGAFDHGDLHLVLLNTTGTGKSLGNIEEQQLLWLSRDLWANQDKAVLIFMHHHPVKCGIPWLDKMDLGNAADFWDIIPPYSKNILGVFFAHLHIQFSTVFRGILVASPPAVSFQYSGNSDASKAELSAEQPGFNLIDVEDRQVRVRTVRFAPPAGAEGQSAADRQHGSADSAEQADQKKG